MAVNVHICGKIVEYETPKKRIIPENINKTKKATFVYTTKQELKITDSIFLALQHKINHIYFVTLTYQWKQDINYGLGFRKKANKDLNRFLKFCRDKRSITRYVGVLELTKKGVPHYHIILDCDLTITGYKRIKANKKNYKEGLWYPPLKAYTIFKKDKKSKYFKTNETNFFKGLQNHWNTITKNIHRNSLDYKQITNKQLRHNNGAYKICKYLTKYFTKELKKPKAERFDFGVRNYFISQKLRIKPITIKSNNIIHSDFIEIQQKAQRKHQIYWNKCSQNNNWTENITYYEQTASYWVLPYGLPPLNTFLARVTYDKPFKTLYDRIKYAHEKTL